MQDRTFRVKNTEYRMQDRTFRVKNTEYMMQDRTFRNKRIQNTGCKIERSG